MPYVLICTCVTYAYKGQGKGPGGLYDIGGAPTPPCVQTASTHHARPNPTPFISKVAAQKEHGSTARIGERLGACLRSHPHPRLPADITGTFLAATIPNPPVARDDSTGKENQTSHRHVPMYNSTSEGHSHRRPESWAAHPHDDDAL